MIKAEEFGKIYDSFIAVRGLTFEVGGGQVLGLVGPNGAGKTTTLKALAGIIPASSGNLRIAGFDVSREPLEAKRNSAYVADDPQLFDDLTVSQHLALTASIYGLRGADEEIGRLLHDFELDSKCDTVASALSRGMRQKLALCCAYLQRPRALMLDEPMTGLDPRGIRNLKAAIAEHAEEGNAVIISSHLLAMVEDICSHVLLMDRGQQRFFGSLPALRSRFAVREDESLEEVFFEALAATAGNQPTVGAKHLEEHLTQ